MILIEPDASFPRAALPKRELSRFLADACERIGLVGEVTVLLSTDAHVQELNRTYRRKNKPTDVLSFPAAVSLFEGAEPTAGDLAISIDTAKRQAEALGHTLKLELQILMLHGLLHLGGFDHEKDTGQMARRESGLRRHYGLPAGLIQRAGRAEDREVKRKMTAGTGRKPGSRNEPALTRVAAPSAQRTTTAKKRVATGKSAPALKSAPGVRTR
jgi:probable rRNA maturation factor